MSRGRTGRQVLTFPAWTVNPYIGILYRAIIARGATWRGETQLEAAMQRLADCGPDDVFHLHWTGPICQVAGDEQEARDRLDQFVLAVTQFRQRGGRLLWTIHNRLPHELNYLELELELCRFLARTADRVHVMSPSTADVVADLFDLEPERVVMVDHPSYQGLYAIGLGDRERARRRLGIAEDRRAVLFFGQMRPYKGLHHLIDALGMLLQDEADLPVLLLAGRARDGVEEVISATLPSGVDIVHDFGHIADEDLPMWFAAADLAVYPYTSILNSGSIHLAATLGVPVVLPGEPHLREQLGAEEWVRFYDPAEPARGIADILAEPASYRSSPAQMRAFSDRLAPWRISRQMADVIDSL